MGTPSYMTSGSAANFNFTSSSPQINCNRDRTKMEKRASPETKQTLVKLEENWQGIDSLRHPKTFHNL